MIGRTLIAAALLAGVPASAKQNTLSGETTIPRISAFLEWRPDGNQALLIRADSGRWYRATLSAPCPRILNRSAMRFIGSPGNRFDRFSAINADGWRCQVASVTRADPPRRR